MLERDYIVEQVDLFVRTVTVPLRLALTQRDLASVREVEEAVGKLLDLDAASALALSPESLVTLMQLSGIGDSVAGYVSYALSRVADAYERAGKKQTGSVRREQARRVAVAFGWNLSDVPEQFEPLEAELRD